MADPAYSLAEQSGTPEALPYTGRGLTRPLTKVGGQSIGLDGSLGQDTTGTYRTWILPLGPISDAQYEALELWVTGKAPPDGHGLGPFELRERGGDPVLVAVLSLDCTVNLFGRVASAQIVLRQVVADAVG